MPNRCKNQGIYLLMTIYKDCRCISESNHSTKSTKCSKQKQSVAEEWNKMSSQRATRRVVNRWPWIMISWFWDIVCRMKSIRRDRRICSGRAHSWPSWDIWSLLVRSLSIFISLMSGLKISSCIRSQQQRKVNRWISPEEDDTMNGKSSLKPSKNYFKTSNNW